jgi:integrase
MLDDIVTRGAPIQANRTLEVVRKLFNWAVGRDLIQLNPCYRVPKPSSENRSDRVLSESEIRAVWNALSAEAPLTAAIFKLRLLTAQRGAEVLTMRWDQIANGWWTIPAQFAKNGLAHRVPLSPQASALLHEIRPLGSGSPWAFPDADGEGHRTAIHKAHERIRRRSQVSFVPHDLRRTAASHMTSMGISRLVVSKILNHVEKGVTAVYDRYSYDREKREALDAWDARLEQIVAERHDGIESDVALCSEHEQSFS